MSTKAHVVEGNRVVATLPHQAFAKEAHLQDLIAQNPHLLAGEQMYPGSDLRFMLVKREIGIQSADGRATRWSLDHLFVDQNGMPTLVEVKRSSDERIRREVVGQLLEYASNCLRSWPAGKLREYFEQGGDTQERFNKLLGPELEVGEDDGTQPQASRERRIDQFWNRVDAKLRKGDIRLVFLADELPLNLVRTIEFLNARFATIEVVGVELKQYSHGEIRFVVPRVVGVSTEVLEKQRRADPDRGNWDEDSFLDVIHTDHGQAARDAVSLIMDWCRENRTQVGFTNSKSGSFVPEVPRGKKMVWPVAINMDGRVTLQLGHLAQRGGGMEPLEAREELLRRLNGFLKERIGLDRSSTQPSFALAELTSADALKGFLKTMDWVKTQIQSSLASQGILNSS